MPGTHPPLVPRGVSEPRTAVNRPQLGAGGLGLHRAAQSRGSWAGDCSVYGEAKWGQQAAVLYLTKGRTPLKMSCPPLLGLSGTVPKAVLTPDLGL